MLNVSNGTPFEYKTLVLKNPSIIFAGRVPWENIPKYYLMANVFATALGFFLCI